MSNVKAIFAVFFAIEGIVGTSRFQKLVDFLQEITEVRLVKGRSAFTLINYHGKPRTASETGSSSSSSHSSLSGSDNVIIRESSCSSSSSFNDEADLSKSYSLRVVVLLR
uniref:Secreted protein n=1 Tax=Panagrellus redivivus TaxID=6233 RepID=A0A7E4VGB8_PANRE